MKNVIIAGIQTRATSDLNQNLNRSVEMVKRAAKSGAKIICLPELFRTPYFPQKRKQNKFIFAETVPSFATRTMQKLAEDLGVVVIVPVYEMTLEKKFLNTALVFDDQGRMLDKYRKIHIPQDPGFYEKEYFEPGKNGYKVYKTKFATFAVLICYDQWYPEAARAARLGGAEIIFYPTAIGDIVGYKHKNDWHEGWETIQRGHAIANSVYVVGVNRVGQEDRMRFFGQSFISDPWGKIVKRASSNREEIIVEKLDLDYNRFLSEGWGFLRNRRPDTYKILTSGKFVEKSRKLKKVAHYEDEKKALTDK